jgi:hypothetical protein
MLKILYQAQYKTAGASFIQVKTYPDVCKPMKAQKVTKDLTVAPKSEHVISRVRMGKDVLQLLCL